MAMNYATSFDVSLCMCRNANLEAFARKFHLTICSSHLDFYYRRITLVTWHFFPVSVWVQFNAPPDTI